MGNLFFPQTHFLGRYRDLSFPTFYQLLEKGDGPFRVHPVGVDHELHLATVGDSGDHIDREAFGHALLDRCASLYR